MTESVLMAQYHNLFEALFEHSVYGVEQGQKQALLLDILTILDQHHRQQCQAYRQIVDEHNGEAHTFSELPFLAVRLFKYMALSSVKKEEVFKTLQSSGTTGAQVAKVILDAQTSRRQSKVLVKIMQETLGKQRLPMLIIDSPAVLKDKNQFSARGAGIQGMAFFGRQHTYALDENMQPNWPVIDEFVTKFGQQPVLIFGFTFMVWLYFIQALKEQQKAISLPNATLIHSGGWKKLTDQQVDNATFKQVLQQVSGVSKCFNFYGMAEQVGSVFVECEAGHLHAPLFADVLVRDPYTLKPLAHGKTGLLQVISVLPTSYPGHSLLTEDLGQIIGVDNCKCGRLGKCFSVHGRLPKTEIRGCSDTHGGGM